MERIINFDKLIELDYKPNPYLENLFSDNENFFSANQVKKYVISLLQNLPDPLLVCFQEQGWKILCTNQRELEKEYGYDFTIYGLTDFEKKEIICYADINYLHETIYHEFGHFLDLALNISSSDQWKLLYENEIKCCGSRYFTQKDNKAECFADALLFYLCESNKKNYTLRKTIKLFSCIFTNIEDLLDLPEVKHNFQKNNSTDHLLRNLNPETKFL